MQNSPTHIAFPHMLRARLAQGPSNGETLLEVELVTIDEVHEGDIVPLLKTMAQVRQVVESRKARGDWSGERWSGVEPKWSKCLCVHVPTPQ